MRLLWTVVIMAPLAIAGCATQGPSPQTSAPTLSAATSPGEQALDASEPVGARAPLPSATMPLGPEATTAVLRAIDEEERADALYERIVARFGPRASGAQITRAEHRHAWVVVSLALAHGVELPPNRYPSAKLPDFASLTAACKAGAEGEKRTIATYDQLLEIELPRDLHRAFTSLRAEAIERHLPAYEACR